MTNAYAIDRHRADFGMPVCTGTSLRTDASLSLLPTLGVDTAWSPESVTVVSPVAVMTDAGIADAKGAFPGRPAWSPPI